MIPRTGTQAPAGQSPEQRHRPAAHTVRCSSKDFIVRERHRSTRLLSPSPLQDHTGKQHRSWPMPAQPSPPPLPSRAGRSDGGPPPRPPLGAAATQDAPLPEGLSKMQLMKMKRDGAVAAAPAAAAGMTTTAATPGMPTATRSRLKTDQALADAPPGMSKLQAMAWQRRREHKRRALLKVRALIFMTGARGLAAAESNGGVVPRAVIKQDEPDGGDGAKSPKPRVIAQLEAKRGSMGRRRWMKIRSLVFMLGAMGLRNKLDAADRATKLVPPPGLSAKERIRWRGERKTNIKRAMLKLRAVIAISGAAGLRDPNTPPSNLSPMEKLKWKAARKEESEKRAGEEASMRA
eukprot:COSAG02_NODE_5107_length_4622_cov_17.347808_1_plen_347_part_10